MVLEMATNRARAANVAPEGVLQRKCACGQSAFAGHECEECKKNSVQRRAAGPGGPASVPPLVHDVLRSPGLPLDPHTRGFLEPRFGHDFSKVRIHADDRAADSAAAANARAYTVGSHIVFGSGQYAPQTVPGKKLIAHELTHVVQQGAAYAGPESLLQPAGREASPLRIGPAEGALEREAESAAGKVFSSERSPAVRLSVSALAIQRAPAGTSDVGLSRENIPPRGPNPATCIQPQCEQLKHQHATGKDALAQVAEKWREGAMGCVSSGASGSKASHAGDILANETRELADEVSDLNTSMPPSLRARDPRGYIDTLVQACQRKQREIGLEFQYNVIFENTTLRKWGQPLSEFDEIESALSALPVEMTWGNPLAITFRREACHPRDMSAGQCAGQGGGKIGGETNPDLTHKKAQINIFDAGLGSAPYKRSKNVGPPAPSATSQTIRHEVGHVINAQIPAKDRKAFFEQVLPWHQYPWAWVSVKSNTSTWKAEREALQKETNMNDTQLDAWMNGLSAGAPTNVGSRTYVKTPVVPGSSNFWLNSYETAAVPTGPEFEYARTSQDEYFSEIFAFALSSPEWLHTVLPRAQVDWLKEVVFKVPKDEAGWATQFATRGPVAAAVLSRLARVFTWEQAQPLLNSALAQPAAGGRQVV